MRVLVAVLLALAILPFGCSKAGDASKGASAGKPPVAVECVKAAPGDIIQGVEVVGSLSAKSQADIRPEIAGIVTHVYATEWVRVKKGTPLAELDATELSLQQQRLGAAIEAARATAKQAEVARNRADREYDRALKLKEAGLFTQQNFDDAATDRDAKAAGLSAAQAQLSAAERDYGQMKTRVGKALLRSPMEGVVSMRNVNVGDMVGDMGGQKVLFHIVDNRLLDLTVTAPSKEIGNIRVGHPLVFSTDAIPGREFEGKVTYINPAVNEIDRSVKIVAQVQNPSEELKTGLFVKGKIITGQRRGVLQVPRTSLLAWDTAGKKAAVFVVVGNKAARKAVTTGDVSMDFVECTSGVAAGDVVVTRGGFSLKDGDAVNVVPGNGR
jgi:RND family efflux transporter MFP subunit